MELILNIFQNIFYLLHEMAPYLLLGFGAAGILSVLVSKDQIEDKIGASNFSSCLKAVLYGIPLPLCSCGVIPVSASLKQHGASRGSIVSFLTTTPQTGVDSLWVTYGMLGAPILIFKLIVAILSGLFAGVLTNLFDTKKEDSNDSVCHEECCDTNKGGIIKRSLTYGFRTLPKDIVEPLLVGLILAGFIGLLAQDNFSPLIEQIKDYNSITKIVVIMIVSIPLYVCATASVPIALMIVTLFGSPGAAIALLIAGPATNVSTITTCIKMIGKRSTFIYVFSIFIFALIAGVIADNLPFITESIPSESFHKAAHQHMHLSWFSYFCVFTLLGVLGFCLIDNKNKKITGSLRLIIEGMTCGHCESNVIKTLHNLQGVKSVSAEHETGEVVLTGSDYNLDQIQKSIESLNYKVISINPEHKEPDNEKYKA